MLAKKFHLPVKKSSNNKNKTSKGSYFIFKKFPNNLVYSRLGIIVGKNIEKSSVKRNKIKRLIMNFSKTKKIHLQPGKDFLIIVFKSPLNEEKNKILKELENNLI